MAAVKDMPHVNSALIIQLSELDTWEPDEIHGNSVRVLGRVKTINAAVNTVTIEYHSRQLKVNTELLTTVCTFQYGMLVQFIGELQKQGDEFVLRARLSRDMTGLETDLYDRCVRIRRNFEKRVLPDVEKASNEANVTSQ